MCCSILLLCFIFTRFRLFRNSADDDEGNEGQLSKLYCKPHVMYLPTYAKKPDTAAVNNGH